MKFIAALLLLIFGLSDGRGVIWDSPCPNQFQYGYLNDEPIGLLNVLLPGESLSSFNVSLGFLPKAAKFKDPAIHPTIELLNEFAPLEIVRDTMLGLTTRYIVHYSRAASLFNYKLVTIRLNGDLVCESEDSK